MSGPSEAAFMARAVRLAYRGLYTTDPNPRVGCVLVQAGRIVGEGWHARAGGPHAERVALQAAGGAAAGATAYVTLEPCNHRGRTGPCTEALLAAGVERVVCGARDPNPHVAGGGIEALRTAGLAVESGLLEAEAEAPNPGYLSRLRRGRPWVRSKLAASLDGRTALADGTSQWISSPAARADVHRWRARSSAVLTGVETVLADDPRLTARLADPALDVTPPWRVVLDSSLRTPPEARVLGTDTRVLIFTLARAAAERRRALEARGATVEVVPGTAHCDLGAVLARLAALEVNEVWVEAGARLNGALLTEGHMDELVLYVAPQILGTSARGMFSIPALERLEDCCRLRFASVRAIGSDLRIVAEPSTLAASAPGA